MRTKYFLTVLLAALCFVTAWAQPFDSDIRQTADYKQAQTWVPVLLRDNAAGYRTNLFAPNTPLVFGTNGVVVANTGTNVLTFTNDVRFGSGDTVINANSAFFSGTGVGINFEEGAFITGDTNSQWRFDMPFYFASSTFAATTRANLGFSTNLNTLWTATNASDAQSALFTATTTNAPTNTNAPTPDAWLDVQVGTNSYKLPLWK